MIHAQNSDVLLYEQWNIARIEPIELADGESAKHLLGEVEIASDCKFERFLNSLAAARCDCSLDATDASTYYPINFADITNSIDSERLPCFLSDPGGLNAGTAE